MPKNVDEFAIEISEIINDDMYRLLDEDDCRYLAEHLLEAGYRKQSEWISVNRGFPNEDGWYITYTNANGKSNGVIAQHLVTVTIRGEKIRRWEWLARVSPWVVTHWMPLPEAPKMQRKEDEGK